MIITRQKENNVLLKKTIHRIRILLAPYPQEDNLWIRGKGREDKNKKI